MESDQASRHNTGPIRPQPTRADHLVQLLQAELYQRASTRARFKLTIRRRNSACGVLHMSQFATSQPRNLAISHCPFPLSLLALSDRKQTNSG